MATKTLEQSAAHAAASSSPEPTEAHRKRKADDIPEADKLEIDVSLPEPPSKKLKRAEKKLSKKAKSKADTTTTTTTPNSSAAVKDVPLPSKDTPEPETTGAPLRSDFGIWIGNLPWSATKDVLRQFLAKEGGIDEKEMLRVHMPAPYADKGAPEGGRPKPLNKGFAYVDFPSQQVLDRALAVSEKLMTGRRVLVKNAKSFAGRPEKTTAAAAEAEKPGVPKKEPAKRIFVGNLDFDVTKDELEEHFGMAGEVEDIHMATFEDSGKCKGFAWVRFKEAEAAEAAVKGFIYKKVEDSDDEAEANGDEESDAAETGKRSKKKTKKPQFRKHKQHLDRLHGRELRREFAEDAQTRYKKRYGKTPASADGGAGGASFAPRRSTTDAASGGGERAARPDADQRREQRRKRHEKLDARTVAPGQALANAQRSTGAIVAGKGRKTAFD